ncbi:diacylglycerol kinase family protein [Thiorhodococcus minor]|uniref:Diacylglycerol kinase n=1 Tax=Thiorhodococcus minor TaxID=57489 RepID=A0A6M0JZ21_9GAMM|nr:diacylglycerol kinase [Thiorhodococcus minor]
MLLVVNYGSGASGTAGEDPIEPQLRQALGSGGIALERIAFDPRHLRQRLAAALARGADRLFVAGGDGTVVAVTEALDGHPIPLGIIPRGTMNWIARDLGIPLDPAAAVDALLRAPIRDIDVGRVNQRPFLCACMVGFGSLLARWRERERGSSPWTLWPKILWRGLGLLQRYRHLRMTLVANGRAERLQSRTLVVTNNLIDQTFGPMPYRPRLDGGQLGIYAVRKASAGELTRLGTRLMLGNWQADDAVLTRSAPSVQLRIARRRALTVMLDGERTRLRTPLNFALEPGALRVLAPAEQP